jgi:hypothetical protein
VAKLTIPSASSQYREMVFQTSVIVRLGTQNRMVTKGYQKGVYDRVTGGTTASVGAGVPARAAERSSARSREGYAGWDPAYTD